MASDLRFCLIGLSARDASYGRVSDRWLAICWQFREPHRNLTKLHGRREVPVRFRGGSRRTVTA